MEQNDMEPEEKSDTIPNGKKYGVWRQEFGLKEVEAILSRNKNKSQPVFIPNGTARRLILITDFKDKLKRIKFESPVLSSAESVVDDKKKKSTTSQASQCLNSLIADLECATYSLLFEKNQIKFSGQLSNDTGTGLIALIEIERHELVDTAIKQLAEAYPDVDFLKLVDQLVEKKQIKMEPPETYKAKTNKKKSKSHTDHEPESSQNLISSTSKPTNKKNHSSVLVRQPHGPNDSIGFSERSMSTLVNDS